MTIVSDNFTVNISIVPMGRVIIYAPCVMLQIVTFLTDDYRGIIYKRNMFIVQATVMFSLFCIPLHIPSCFKFS
jgi:hypothetical protein